MRSQRPRRLVAVLASLAAVGALGMFGAPGALAASPESTGQGTGPQPTGLGMGSKAALAQPTCSDNGRTSLALEGTGPLCVNPWPAGKNNGGATAPGVTKDSVKAIIYIENQQQASGGTGSQAPVDQTTGKTGTVQDAIRDSQKAYDVRAGATSTRIRPGVARSTSKSSRRAAPTRRRSAPTRPPSPPSGRSSSSTRPAGRPVARPHWRRRWPRSTS